MSGNGSKKSFQFSVSTSKKLDSDSLNDYNLDKILQSNLKADSVLIFNEVDRDTNDVLTDTIHPGLRTTDFGEQESRTGRKRLYLLKFWLV